MLIVALGNPGKKYLLTPHNIGWIVISALAHSLNIPWQNQKKGPAEVAISPKKHFMLVKPLTYMNLSGQAVKALMNYYRLDLNNLLVIQDDIDLPFLSVRFQKNRGSAGHKGIKSVHEELKSQDYARMRIGMQVLEDDLPTKLVLQNRKREVLKPFSKAEQKLLPEFLNKSIEAILYFMKEGFEKTANRYN